MARLLCQKLLKSSCKLASTSSFSCIVTKEWTCVHRCLPKMMLHSSSWRCGLMEFFDEKANWGEPKVVAGRPWKKDELRIKSNTDLHKLWYVLLKERNMLMTMEAEYKSQGELFPNPERFEKVEETMENILEVVAERNRAYNLLETGETGEPGRHWVINELGQGRWRREIEHYKPNPGYSAPRLSGRWQNKFLRLYREKRIKEKSSEARREKKFLHKLKEKFPDAEID